MLHFKMYYFEKWREILRNVREFFDSIYKTFHFFFCHVNNCN